MNEIKNLTEEISSELSNTAAMVAQEGENLTSYDLHQISGQLGRLANRLIELSKKKEPNPHC